MLASRIVKLPCDFKVAAEVARKLAASGYRVTIVSGSKCEAHLYVSSDGVTVVIEVDTGDVIVNYAVTKPSDVDKLMSMVEDVRRAADEASKVIASVVGESSSSQ